MKKLNVKKCKFGKKPKKTDSRTLQAENYIPIKKLKVPLKRNWSLKVSRLGEMLNTKLDDCTCAAAGHLIQTWTANAGKQVILPDSDILKLYEKVGHYVPSKPKTDTGAACLDVLNYWRKQGVGEHKITAFVEVNPQNTYFVQHAIDLFGGLYVGFALPKTAEGKLEWNRVWNAAPDLARPSSYAYHCVAIVGYDQENLIGISWGQRVKIDWPFFVRYCDEAYAAISPDWAKKLKSAPSGFNFTALEKDLKALKRAK